VHQKLLQNQDTNGSIEDLIIKTINEKNPQTTRHLVDLIQKKTNLSKNEIIIVLDQLETENKIHFNIKSEQSTSFETYIFGIEAAWYWTVITIALVTTLAVFVIPQDWYPTAYLRNILGVVFVLFLPGYAFVKAIFQRNVPIKTSSESFDNIELLVLSIALSTALTPIVGLVLYYTPIGIGLTPITLSLLVLTLLFATAAMAREYQAKSNIQQSYLSSLRT
jgi:uncharacterized membrane protein